MSEVSLISQFNRISKTSHASESKHLPPNSNIMCAMNVKRRYLKIDIKFFFKKALQFRKTSHHSGQFYKQFYDM
jgi:hypothetical protein